MTLNTFLLIFAALAVIVGVLQVLRRDMVVGVVLITTGIVVALATVIL